MERFRVPEQIAVRVAAEDMHATVRGIFSALGVPDDDARLCADALLYADVRGIDSHGVSNMTPVYVAGLEQGWIEAAPEMRVVRDAPAVATVDSDRGLGLCIGPRCMELALDKAERCGVGAVAVMEPEMKKSRNSSPQKPLGKSSGRKMPAGKKLPSGPAVGAQS